ncbi:Probable endopeptidase cgR_2070 precursor [Actinomadura madurae]|nr:Probable endopeptidase cgR_2070 precursor [Actinomadura madurae]
MSIARHSHGDGNGCGAFAGHNGRNPAATRKQTLLRMAVTVTATGLALAVPAGSQALAAVNPAVLRSLHLDSATMQKVQAYDRYRTREAKQRKRAKKAMRFARKQIGKPYRWGADGPHGYDCSGLAMAAWRRAGVKIPRVTYAQYRRVARKVRLKDLKPGDLVFFHGRSHVGLYAGHGRFLHAPHSGANVRIDKFGARRKRQFAGAVRPGAPAYKEWSPSVKELVERIDRMSAEKRADRKPPDKERTPQIPPPAATSPKKTDNPPKIAPRPNPAQQTAPPGGRPSVPDDDDSAAPPPRTGGTPAGPPGRAKPGPRPRLDLRKIVSSRHRHWHRGESLPWAKYAGL